MVSLGLYDRSPAETHVFGIGDDGRFCLGIWSALSTLELASLENPNTIFADGSKRCGSCKVSWAGSQLQLLEQRIRFG